MSEESKRVLKRFGRGLVAALLAASLSYAMGFLQNEPGVNPYLVMVGVPLLNALGKWLRDMGWEGVPV